MSRESEVVAYLRADTDLAALVPGGVYADADLAVSGITDPTDTPDVWADGFQTTVVVRQRAAVPTGEMNDLKTQETVISQVVEVWVYALEADAIEGVMDAIYGLIQGHRFTGAWRANWAATVGILPAPELPPGTKCGHIDFAIRSIRQPVVT